MSPSHARAGLLLLPVLAACGGGGSDGYQAAVDRANAKEAQARALAATSPCSSAAQCDSLLFRAPTHACGNHVFQPYSLVSATAAAASAAAAEQRELASQAAQLAPPSNIVCPAVVPQPPVLACRASNCQVQ